MTNKAVINTKITMGIISLREDGILQLEITLSDDLGAETMLEFFDVTKTMIDKKCPLLVKHLISHSLSSEAQQKISKREEFSAVAIYAATSTFFTVDSLLCKTTKTSFPMKAFNNEDEAIA